MVGISREEQARQLHLWRKDAASHEPIERHGVRIMSVGFLIGERQALPMGAPLLTAALKPADREREWGEPRHPPARPPTGNR